MLDLNITLVFQLVNFFIALYVLNLLLIRPIREIIRKRKAVMDDMSGESESYEYQAEQPVCRAFDPEFEFVAGLVRAVDAESGFAVIGAEDASSGEPADRDSVVSEDHGFSARIEDEREFETFEFLRNGSRDMKPCAGAVLSPPSARFESGILKSEPFFKRNGPFGWREHAIETERV